MLNIFKTKSNKQLRVAPRIKPLEKRSVKQWLERLTRSHGGGCSCPRHYHKQFMGELSTLLQEHLITIEEASTLKNMLASVDKADVELALSIIQQKKPELFSLSQD